MTGRLNLGCFQPTSSDGSLVIVPCGKSKIWDRNPDLGSVATAEAYTGTPFRLNRQYAERFGDAWVVLSAKYGFIAPDFSIPAPYEVSFNYPATEPIAFDRLRQQMRERRLDWFPVIVGLGDKEYRAAVADDAGSTILTPGAQGRRRLTRSACDDVPSRLPRR
jgi:hypothetical protein